MARAFEARGDRVRVAVPLPDDDRGRWDDVPPLEAVHRGHAWRPGWRTVGTRLDGHLLAASALRGADLVWERHEPRSAAVSRWCRALRIPRFVELNAPLSLERRWPRPPRPGELRREARTLRNADRVIAVSAWLARWAVAQGCAPERVCHVPNGVDPQAPGAREATRVRLGLHGPVFGFVGSMSPWQGADRIPDLLDRLPGWTALAVGDGASPPRPHPRLRAVGRVDPRHVPDLVAAMDVGIAPYPSSAPPWFCPLKVLAYRAQGVPVVASATGDAAALVGDGGEVVAPDAGDAWAAAIRRAIGRPRVPVVRSWDDVLREALAD